MASKIRRSRKTIKRLKKRRKTLKPKYKGGFSELSYFLQKGLSVFQMDPTSAFGNTSLVPPFPYFQSK